MLNQAMDSITEFLRVDYAFFARRGLQIIGVLVLAILLYRLLRVLTRRIEHIVEDQDPSSFSAREQRARTLAQLMNSVGGVVITVGAGLMVLNFFFPIAPLLAGVGVAGLAISFGAQSLVKDVISGFFMLMEDQFSVGDIVKVGDIGGVVERMTMRIVMVRDVHGVLHIVPNGSINRVSNLTRGWGRSVLDIGVAYQENVDRVIKLMRAVGTELWNDEEWRPRLVEEPAVWGVEALADSSVNVRIIANTVPGKQWEVSRELRRRIKNRFDEEGVEIPFPQRTVHLGTDVQSLLELLSEKKSPRTSRK
jgi:small conductance mechanosensitive channel